MVAALVVLADSACSEVVLVPVCMLWLVLVPVCVLWLVLAQCPQGAGRGRGVKLGARASPYTAEDML